MNPKLIAQALRQMGVNNSKTDRDLVYVTPEEEAMLKANGGSGRIDPDTGLQHYDGEGSTEDAGLSGQGQGDWTSQNDPGANDGGGGYSGNEAWEDIQAQNEAMANASRGDPGSWTMNYEDVAAQMQAAWDAAKNASRDEDINGPDMTVSGRQGPGVDVGKTDAEYESIYGAPPATSAQAINDAYDSFQNETNATGYLGRGLGTIYDVYQGATKGAGLGPAGVFAGGLFGGFTGKNGDRGESIGRGAVQESLLNGTWHNQGDMDNAGNGEDASFSDMGTGDNDPSLGTYAPTSTPDFLTQHGGFTKTAYESSPAKIANALRSGPKYSTTQLDTTPLEGIRRRYYGE
jgi:hypothetical protein